MSKKNSNFAAKFLVSMKKSTIFFVLSIALISFLFSSWKGNKGDIMEGTWKSDMGINSSIGGSEIEMIYVFDGKENYTYTSYDFGEVIRTIKGTYKLVDEKYLHTYYTITNKEGISQSKEDVLELDTSSKPYKLSTNLYDADGNLLSILWFIKQ